MYNILMFVFTFSLPALNNVYSGSLYIPLLGKQNIEFERLKPNISQVRLHGLINCDGLIYNDENINKDRCIIDAPTYDVTNDSILFVLKINMIGITKRISLLNTKK